MTSVPLSAAFPFCVATRAVYRDVSPERADQEMRARLVGTLEASPDFVAIATVVRDLSHRSRAEAALRESDARFRAAVDGSLDSFMALRSVHPAVPASLADLLQTADTALYVAKRARSALTLASSATSAN